MSNQFQAYLGTGVCDVCNRPLGGINAYIVPNNTFYSSRKYREYVRNNSMSAFLGIPMNDAYFEQMRAQDKSAGSAVCQNCINLFESPSGAVYSQQQPPPPQSRQPYAPPPAQQSGQSYAANPQTTTQYTAPAYAAPQKKPKKKTGLIVAASVVGFLLLVSVILVLTIGRGQLATSDRTDGGGRTTRVTEDRGNDENGTREEQSASPESPASQALPTEEPASPEPEPDIFPVHFVAYNNDYSVTGYEIGADDNGTTTITLFGAGYSILPIRNGSIRVPVWTQFYSSGTLHSSTGCSTSPDQMTYYFSVSAPPELIEVTNGDTGEIFITIEVSSGSISSSGRETLAYKEFRNIVGDSIYFHDIGSDVFFLIKADGTGLREMY